MMGVNNALYHDREDEPEPLNPILQCSSNNDQRFSEPVFF